MSGSASMPAPSPTEKAEPVLRVGRTMAYDHACLTRDTGVLTTIDTEGGETGDPPSTATAPAATGATRTRARKDRTASADSGQPPDGAARAGITGETTSGGRPARRTKPPAIGR